MNNFVRFPQSLEAIQELETQFQSLGDFPGMFTIIDDTAYCIGCYETCSRVYVCQSKNISLNQHSDHHWQPHVYLEHKCKIPWIFPWLINLEVFFGWCVFKRCLSTEMDQTFDYFMIGDKGFPLQPWLLTPYDRPCTSHALILFNSLHKEMRSLIDWLIKSPIQMTPGWWNKAQIWSSCKWSCNILMRSTSQLFNNKRLSSSSWWHRSYIRWTCWKFWRIRRWSTQWVGKRTTQKRYFGSVFYWQ